MNSLFAQFSNLARLLTPGQDLSPVDGVAHSLMERAEAGAGRDPYQSQELRSAAQAFLSVVR